MQRADLDQVVQAADHIVDLDRHIDRTVNRSLRADHTISIQSDHISIRRDHGAAGISAVDDRIRLDHIGIHISQVHVRQPGKYACRDGNVVD